MKGNVKLFTGVALLLSATLVNAESMIVGGTYDAVELDAVTPTFDSQAVVPEESNLLLGARIHREAKRHSLHWLDYSARHTTPDDIDTADHVNAKLQYAPLDIPIIRQYFNAPFSSSQGWE